MEFTNTIITYQDLIDGNFPVNDEFEIAKYEYDKRREAFLACPNLPSPLSPYMYLSLADGIVVGRTFYFNTRLKAGEECLLTSTGSALLVHEDYRKYALAVDIMMFNKSELQLTAGVSQIALPLYNKLKYFTIKFPKLRLVKRYDAVLKSRGIPGFISKIVSLPFQLYSYFKGYRRRVIEKKLSSVYRIESVKVVPDWVDDVVLNDGHKYSEYHDHKWLQWNLDYSFKSAPQNIQSFYVIYKESNPCGFFMTKERLMPQSKNITGSVVEWGIKCPGTITETEINILSIKTFSHSCSYVELASDSEDTVMEMKRFGFSQLQEDANILFRDRTKDKRYRDAKDPSLWRLRLGYADTIMSY